jgi:hypothetical protein
MQNRIAVTKMPGQEEFQLVASDDFRAGEIVVAEEATIWVPADHDGFYRFAWALVDQLFANREKLAEVESWALKQSLPPEYDEADLRTEKNLARGANKKRQEIRRLYQIIVANNIATLDFHGDVTGFGLFQVLSRTNHSCNPNVVLQPGRKSIYQVQLVAKRSIDRGEPITWCYAGGKHEDRFLALDRRLRQQVLMRDFNFECWCPRCLQEDQHGL